MFALGNPESVLLVYFAGGANRTQAIADVTPWPVADSEPSFELQYDEAPRSAARRAATQVDHMLCLVAQMCLSIFHYRGKRAGFRMALPADFVRPGLNG
jgi:hypothetical protein